MSRKQLVSGALFFSDGTVLLTVSQKKKAFLAERLFR
jgi:hypothetical protein